MTPPEAPKDGTDAAQRETPPAVLSCPPSGNLTTLRQRRDFQRATRALHVAMPGFILQMRARHPEEFPEGPTAIRVGFTCSKKVGNAVARNRAKRRLREIARLLLPTEGRAGMDYVLVGRKDATASLPFDRLLADLRKALAILHGKAA